MNHPIADSFEITALLRNEEKAKALESKFRVKTLLASHSEHDKIEDAVAANYVILHIVRTSSWEPVLIPNLNDLG